MKEQAEQATIIAHSSELKATRHAMFCLYMYLKGNLSPGAVGAARPLGNVCTSEQLSS